MQLTFRQATPLDVDKAAPLIYSSGPLAWEYVFAGKKTGSALNFMKFSFLKRKGQLGCNNHIVALINDEVVGCATYYSTDVTFKYLFNNLKNILSFYNFFDAFKVIMRGLRTENVLRPPKKGSHYIAHVGIDPKYRGKGFGNQLMHHLIKKGIDLNRKYAELDVAHNNLNAYRLYKRLGFKDFKKTIASDSLKNEFGKIIDHINMRKPL